MTLYGKFEQWLRQALEDNHLLGLHLNSEDKSSFLVGKVVGLVGSEYQFKLFDSQGGDDGILYGLISEIQRITYESNYLDFIERFSSRRSVEDQLISVVENFSVAKGILDALIIASRLDMVVKIFSAKESPFDAVLFGATDSYIDLGVLDDSVSVIERMIYNADDVCAVKVGGENLLFKQELYSIDNSMN